MSHRQFKVASQEVLQAIHRDSVDHRESCSTDDPAGNTHRTIMRCLEKMKHLHHAAEYYLNRETPSDEGTFLRLLFYFHTAFMDTNRLPGPEEVFGKDSAHAKVKNLGQTVFDAIFYGACAGYIASGKPAQGWLNLWDVYTSYFQEDINPEGLDFEKEPSYIPYFDAEGREFFGVCWPRGTRAWDPIPWRYPIAWECISRQLIAITPWEPERWKLELKEELDAISCTTTTEVKEDSLPGKDAQNPRNLGNFAIGLEDGTTWRAFTRKRDNKGRQTWRELRKVAPAISNGAEATLLAALAKNGGCLSKREAIDLFKHELLQKNKTAKREENPDSLQRSVLASVDRDIFLNKVTAPLSRIRGKLRKTFHWDDRTEPFPFQEETGSYLSDISVGYAIMDDDGRRTFKTHDQLTEDEQLDV